MKTVPCRDKEGSARVAEAMEQNLWAVVNMHNTNLGHDGRGYEPVANEHSDVTGALSDSCRRDRRVKLASASCNDSAGESCQREDRNSKPPFDGSDTGDHNEGEGGMESMGRMFAELASFKQMAKGGQLSRDERLAMAEKLAIMFDDEGGSGESD